MKPEEVRKLFPVFKKRNYLFSSGIAPASILASEAVRSYIENLTYSAAHFYRDAGMLATEVKNLFARLMNCDASEVALTEGTTAASNIAVDLITPVAGSNVIFDDFSYPSSVYPWLLPPHNIVEKRFIRQKNGIIDIEDLEDAIDDKTIAVSVSHVSPFEGFRHNITRLAEIAHAYGALLLVDGAQGAGADDLDLHACGVDFYSCSAMKWLLGSPGVGFLYVAKRHLDRIPTRAGYVAGGFDIENFILVSSASRFEMGKPNYIGLAYTKPGLKILLEAGLKNIKKHILGLSGQIISGLKERKINVVTPLNPLQRLGIVAVHSADAERLFEVLNDHKIDTYSKKITLPYYGGGALQLGTHIYNNNEDIKKFFKILDNYFIQS